MIQLILQHLTYAEISRFVTSIVSVVMVIALYDQAWKLWRTRSAKDFTKSIIVGIIVNEVGWLNYGWAIREWPIIGVCTLTTIAAIWIVAGYIRATRWQADR